MPNRANPKHLKEIENCITLAEASRIYKVSVKTLTYAIDANNIIARRCGRIVLISKSSSDAWYYHKR
jgi:hypothetical protein